eukprot:8012868-Alexandrium_andersonii.AAC.1
MLPESAQSSVGCFPTHSGTSRALPGSFGQILASPNNCRKARARVPEGPPRRLSGSIERA